MGRKFGLTHQAWQRGSWTREEDHMLVSCIEAHGASKWSSIAAKAGLKRSGKSCRLRWLNYLRPDIKRGNITEEEEELIIRLHKLLGNRWSLIAGRIPGRTDNEIKNYWNKVIRKRTQKGGSSESHVAPAPCTAEAAQAEVAAAAEDAERCRVLLEPNAAEVQAVEDYNWSNSLATADDDNHFFGDEENIVAVAWAAGESGLPLFCAGHGDLMDDLFVGEEDLMYYEWRQNRTADWPFCV